MDRLFYPVGNVRDGQLEQGGGIGTGRYLSIDYSPPGDSYVPAFSVSRRPPDDSETPVVHFAAGDRQLGNVLTLDRIEDGLFFGAYFEGEEKTTLDEDGSLDLQGYAYARWANAGGIHAVDDGNTDVDMTQGNAFTCTPAENTVFTTTSPTNGFGGQLACFIINNSGGYTVSWSTGFTDITAIAASETGVTLRLMQFDGTTWREITQGAGGGEAGIPKGVAFTWAFKLVDETDLWTPETGISPTATISKDGAAFTALAGSPSVSEIGSGWYKVTVAAADMNYDVVILKATGTGCAQSDQAIYTST